jgi:hypothetical protein
VHSRTISSDVVATVQCIVLIYLYRNRYLCKGGERTHKLNATSKYSYLYVPNIFVDLNFKKSTVFSNTCTSTSRVYRYIFVVYSFVYIYTVYIYRYIYIPIYQRKVQVMILKILPFPALTVCTGNFAHVELFLYHTMTSCTYTCSL